jgi:hypothetical protein
MCDENLNIVLFVEAPHNNATNRSDDFILGNRAVI